ncbi:MucBP domain-containing protein [Lactobacillus sp.]|uniref:MucBP domain-containing protein n=1 Tax=Lactobacillus sp. TaxID=1591 RepID=UPI00258C1887|nr:MucBP domain-containing protein [Lactobacillus sp.]MCO6530254.1 KxYKxGKxW signal peptide domain-containing protein [Lactobacillus sp.]
MKNKIKKYLLMDKKVHYKMYKSGKHWLVAGIATMGFGLTLGLTHTTVSAAEGNKSAVNLSKDNHFLKDYNGNSLLSVRSQGQSFKQQYGAPLTTANSVPVFGQIKTGEGSILKYFYGDGTSRPLATLHESDSTGQISGGANVSLLGALPNFNVLKNGKHISNALFDSGRRRGRIKIGINNDMNTLAGPVEGSQRLWSIEKVPTPGMPTDPNNPELNQTLIVKYSSDYLINGKTYTIDYTQTFKPMGSYVDYHISARNVTGLDSNNPSDPSNDMKGVFFESDFDTYFEDEDVSNPDDAPMYYLGNNAGLYHKGHGYKLKYYFTASTAPTGWISPYDAYTDAKALFNNDPNSLGSKVPEGEAHHQEGEKATTTNPRPGRSDPGLFMIWKSQDLAQGATREMSYQTGLTDGDYKGAQLKLDKEADDFKGGAYKVTGKVSDENTNALPLKYYYVVDGGEVTEFQGPTLTDSSEQPFEFTVPSGKMKVGGTHQISVYTVDKFGVISPTQFLTLTTPAGLNAEDKVYFVGDKFTKYDSIANSVDEKGNPYGDSTNGLTIEIKDENGNILSDTDVAQITSQPGKYKISYTYKYILGKVEKTVNAESNITVCLPDDASFGADFKLKEKTYYVGDAFNADDSFDSGRKNGSEAMNASDLQHEIDGSNDQDITKNPGTYKVTYKYSYGNNGQAIAKDINVKVIDAKHIDLKYVDQNNNGIFDEVLATLSDDLKNGEHKASYGSKFQLDPAKELLLNSTPFYEFDHAEKDNQNLNVPVELTFGDENQEITLIYKGAKVKAEASDPSAITIQHVLDDGNNTPVPGMQDSYLGGSIGDKVKVDLKLPEHKAPAGYKLKDGQTFEDIILKPNGAKTLKVIYEAETQDNITVHLIDVNHPDKDVTAVKPTGHKTGDKFDPNSVTIPDGYEISDLKDENGNPLKDKNGKELKQPEETEYTTTPQNPTLWIIGQKVKDDGTDQRAITVHYYTKDNNGNERKIKDDVVKGGRVGDTLEFLLKDQKIPGYTLVPGQKDEKRTLSSKPGKDVNFYYTADGVDNITIDFEEAKSGKKISSYTPKGNHVGDALDVTANGLKNKIPKGYHVASKDELDAINADGKDRKQPEGIKYTDQKQDLKVYVIGNEVKVTDKNALTVHYYLRDKDGKNTTKTVKKDEKLGGTVGETIEVRPDQIPGYTVTDPKAQKYTFDPEKGGEIIFYYTADELNNITIDFVDIKDTKIGDSYKPKGYIGEKVNLTDEGLKGHLPKGYHVATGDELKTGTGNETKTQPKNPEFKADNQNTTPVKVIVAPNVMNYITVEFVDKDNGVVLYTDKPEKRFKEELNLSSSESYVKGILDKLALSGYVFDRSDQLDNKVTYDDPDSTPKTVKVFVEKIQSAAKYKITYLTKSGKILQPSPNEESFGKGIGETYDITGKINPPTKKYRLLNTQPEKNKFRGIVPASGTIVINVYCERVK